MGNEFKGKTFFRGEQILTFTPNLLLQNGESGKFTLVKMPRVLI